MILIADDTMVASLAKAPAEKRFDEKLMAQTDNALLMHPLPVRRNVPRSHRRGLELGLDWPFAREWRLALELADDGALDTAFWRAAGIPIATVQAWW